MKNLLKNLSLIDPVSPATQKHQFWGTKKAGWPIIKKNLKVDY
jgi:hypothetical protein